MKWLEKVLFVVLIGLVVFAYFIGKGNKPATIENKQISVVFVDDKSINFDADKFVEYENKLVIVTKGTIKKDETGKPVYDSNGLPVMIPSEVVTLPLESIKGYTYLR